MSKVKKLLALAAATLLGLVVGVAVVSPAYAAYTDCPASQAACFWWDINGNPGAGFRVDVPYSYGCKNVSTFNNDQFSSLRLNSVAHGINTGVLLQWWENGNCSGQSQYWLPFAAPRNGNFSGPWNDKVSAYALYDCYVDIRC